MLMTNAESGVFFQHFSADEFCKSTELYSVRIVFPNCLTYMQYKNKSPIS